MHVKLVEKQMNECFFDSLHMYSKVEFAKLYKRLNYHLLKFSDLYFH